MRILTDKQVGELRAAANFYAAKAKASQSRFLTDEYRAALENMAVGDSADIFEDLTADEVTAVKAIVAAKGVITDTEILAKYRKTLNAAKADFRAAIREVKGHSANVQTSVDESGNVYGAFVDAEGNFGYMVRRTA